MPTNIKLNVTFCWYSDIKLTWNHIYLTLYPCNAQYTQSQIVLFICSFLFLLLVNKQEPCVNKMSDHLSTLAITAAAAVPAYFFVSKWAQGGQFKKDDVQIDGKIVVITGANTGIYQFLLLLSVQSIDKCWVNNCAFFLWRYWIWDSQGFGKTRRQSVSGV